MHIIVAVLLLTEHLASAISSSCQAKNGCIGKVIGNSVLNHDKSSCVGSCLPSNADGPVSPVSLLAGGPISCISLPAAKGMVLQKKGHKKKILAGVLVIVGASMILFVLIFAHLCFSEKEKQRSNHYVDSFLEKFGSLAPKRFSYLEVKRMTDNFSEKLGKGGFGTVFKGKFTNGQLVAVKVLNSSRASGKDFFNEVIGIGCTYHVNVVSLLGFCLEGSRRVLIYEFMANGSLDKLIFSDDDKASNQGWRRKADLMLHIAVGIARGLDYLHQGCNIGILHFDIKPHNILLDDDYCPKIADFGLAKLCRSEKRTISMCGARGTIGYMAPEVFRREYGEISSKSDVYSYGMVVLEMIAGRRNVDRHQKNSSKVFFLEWIYEHLEMEEDDHLKQTLGLDGETEKNIRRMAMVGLWCIQTRPEDRPSMSKVVAMLEGKIGNLAKPPMPSLSTPLPNKRIKGSSVAYQTQECELITPPSART